MVTKWVVPMALGFIMYALELIFVKNGYTDLIPFSAIGTTDIVAIEFIQLLLIRR